MTENSWLQRTYHSTEVIHRVQQTLYQKEDASRGATKGFAMTITAPESNRNIHDSTYGGTMKRKASAVWQGDLKTGKGAVSTESGVLSQTQYSFTTRFENGKGTNPEELVAAAHAGCFTMALSAQLGEAGLVPEKLETTATMTFEKLEAGWTV